MKTLSLLVSDYTVCLQQNDLQLAHKGILGFMSKLRADFICLLDKYSVNELLFL